MIRLAQEAEPRAVMIENVRGMLAPRFDGYRQDICSEFERLGYTVFPFRLLQASDYGVPQLRPRAIFVAIKEPFAAGFSWPKPSRRRPKSVGETLLSAVAAHGREGAEDWANQADRIAPTLCGGSKLHGGPDLGPTRARQAWALMGVDGLVLANEPPQPSHQGPIQLTVEMTALLQGFPKTWKARVRRHTATARSGMPSLRPSPKQSVRQSEPRWSQLQYPRAPLTDDRPNRLHTLCGRVDEAPLLRALLGRRLTADDGVQHRSHQVVVVDAFTAFGHEHGSHRGGHDSSSGSQPGADSMGANGL